MTVRAKVYCQAKTPDNYNPETGTVHLLVVNSEGEENQKLFAADVNTFRLFEVGKEYCVDIAADWRVRLALIQREFSHTN